MNIFIFLTLILVSQWSFGLGLNDVSILLPLPQNKIEFQQMIPAQEPARPEGGPLVPAKYINQLPQLILDDLEPEVRPQQLRVIALRFDPCFHESAHESAQGPAPCRRQIRLVFQPVSFHQERAMTFDAALHAFYDFSESEWKDVIHDWKQTRAGTQSEALQVHPVIQSEGLGGQHWGRLRTLILKHCQLKNLKRVTISSVNSFGFQWVFQGMDIDDAGNSSFINIPRVHKDRQMFFTNLSNLQEFTGTIHPAPEGEELWIKFLKSSKHAKNSLTEEQLMKILGRSLEFENPRLTNTANLDCVSCHVAQTNQFWGAHNLANWKTDLELNIKRFTSPWNLQNTSVRPFRTNQIRAFGYFLDEPIISGRVINESAEVAEMMKNF